jgi:hypothetical protein
MRRENSQPLPLNTAYHCGRRPRDMAHSRGQNRGPAVCVKYADQCSRRSPGAFIAERRPGPAAPSGWRPRGDTPTGLRGRCRRAVARRRGDQLLAATVLLGASAGAPRCAGRAAPRRCTAQAGGVRRGAPVQAGDPRRAAPRCEVTTTGDAPRRSVAPPAARRADRRRQEPAIGRRRTREPRAHPAGRRPCERRAPGSEIGLAGRPPCRQAPGVGRTAWATVMATARATAGAAALAAGVADGRRPRRGPRRGYTHAVTWATGGAIPGADKGSTAGYMGSPGEYPGVLLVRSTAVHTMMLRSTGSRIDPASRLFLAGFLGMMSS